MYISTVIVDKQHYLFHAATAAAGRVVHKKIKSVTRIIHIKKVVHKKIKSVKGFIHNKTYPVEISIGICRYGAGIKLVKKIGRLFSQKGYEFSDNVTETAVDGGANLIFQNGSYIKISKAMVDGDANFTIQDGSDIRMSEGGGGKTLLTLNMSGGGVCYNFETGATACMVSKDKVGDNVTETTVDAFDVATDCMVS